MMQFVKFLPIAFLFAFLVLIVSCESDKSTEPGEQPPTIPPQNTMMIDFSEFPDTSSGDGFKNLILSKGNWGWAALNVATWNSALTLALVVPVAAFAESFNHLPVKQQDGSWLWQYTVSTVEDTFTIKLFGKPVAEGIEWEMFVSSGLTADFKWFYGFSNANATRGDWTLNKDLSSPTPFLHIEWNRDPQAGTADVKYTNIIPGVPENGSYIHYGKTNEVPHNRFYQIFGSEENRTIDIKWNYEQHFGRVMNPMFFHDENWHCWDDRLEDTDCTE